MEACAKQSWMLAWEAFLYFALLDGVALLGLNHLFIAHKQNIERFLSGLTGDCSGRLAQHVLANQSSCD